jgi:hypothetical protein
MRTEILTTIVIFDTPTIAKAREVVRNSDLAWFVAPSGAVHDVLLSDLAREPFVSSRPAIFPDLEQALATMPVDEPELVWLTGRNA